MPARRAVRSAVVAAVALGLSAYMFGGWAVITVDDVEGQASAGARARAGLLAASRAHARGSRPASFHSEGLLQFEIGRLNRPRTAGASLLAAAGTYGIILVGRNFSKRPRS